MPGHLRDSLGSRFEPGHGDAVHFVLGASRLMECPTAILGVNLVT